MRNDKTCHSKVEKRKKKSHLGKNMSDFGVWFVQPTPSWPKSQKGLLQSLGRQLPQKNTSKTFFF